MKPTRKQQEWSMVGGDTLSFNVEIEGLEEDLRSMYFSCKPMTADYYVFQKDLNNGCRKIELGKYNIRVAPEDTQNLDPGKYRMDLQIGINNDKYTILQGTLNIVRDITQI